MDTSELESDPDLARIDEPDSWSSSIDRKAMKKLSLSKKDVKRQENIFGEFIPHSCLGSNGALRPFIFFLITFESLLYFCGEVLVKYRNP